MDAAGEELRRGPWTADEDALLAGYVAAHGEGRWNELARAAGLRRSGKSCRLRWLNYLCPDVRRGDLSPQEQLLIFELHSRWGNRWSKIATHLPGRTDNEVKKYWRTRVQKHAKQLGCDVGSHRFHDVVRNLWMPRLLERIHTDDESAAPADVMEGTNGGRRGSSLSYSREITGSNVSSSRSGTIVSTAYTSSGASSRFSTFSAEATMRFDSMAIHEKEEEHAAMHFDSGIHEEEEQEKRRDRIRSLIQEFSIAPSANRSVKIGGMSVVERWLTELGVGWVLSLDDFAPAGEELDRDLRRWIQALDEIAQTMCSMRPIFPDIGSMGLSSIGEEEGEHVGETCSLTRHHLILFIQEAMLKMLSFVDIILALDTFYSNMAGGFPDPAIAPLYNKLIALLRLHDALSQASNKIVSQFGPPTSVEVERIENEMTIILSANKSKLGEAIWSKMENIRTKSMEEDSSSSLDPQGSSDIHKATRSIVMYIKFLRSNDRLVDAIIRDKYMRDNIEHVRPMISEMVSCLEEKLANVSKSFPDEGLMFLFLLNNFNTILQAVQELYLIYLDLAHKIECHMERYVEVSWAPLLSCLLNPMPLCLGKRYSPLSKFESEFHKIYTIQKQWKVLDPELRRRLRISIRDKIIPAYTEYLEDNKVATPKFSLQELDEMLKEMFEG